jgi:ribosomal protein S18 acetylase RimI-like enzyme
LIFKDHIKIRSARLEESSVLAALSIQVWLDTYATYGISSVISNYVLNEFSPDNFLSKLKNTEESFLIAEYDNNIVGFIELVENRPCPHKPEETLEIDKFYVMPRFHGHGIGSELLYAATNLCYKKGYSSFWLTTWHQNLDGIHFYESKGFENIGVINFKICNTDAPNIIFIKNLDI